MFVVKCASNLRLKTIKGTGIYCCWYTLECKEECIIFAHTFGKLSKKKINIKAFNIFHKLYKNSKGI